jgi:putative redox protein
MRNERVEFAGSTGRLVGRLRRPAGRPVAWALFAHCFTCGKDLHAARRISEALAARGIGVLRFDFTGLGESDGDFADTTFVSNVDDLVSAAQYLEQVEAAPTLLVGHSLGGAAVIRAACRLPSVRAVATVGAPYDPSHTTHLLQPVEAELRERGEAELTLAGRTLRVGVELLADLGAQSIHDDLGRLERALLVLHSPQDRIVEVDHARRLYEAARHPKSFVTLDGADHLLSDPADASYVGEVIGAWVSRYLPASVADERQVEEGLVEVTTGQRYRSEVRTGAHRLVADEPVRLGGDDSGPTPYDLLLAGLGSCTGITLRMYADRKEWPLDEVRVVLSHRKVHAKDCVECTAESGRVDVIERRITLDGALDDEQRGRLLEIADRCPVHRTLHGEVSVRTVLED